MPRSSANRSGAQRRNASSGRAAVSGRSGIPSASAASPTPTPPPPPPAVSAPALVGSPSASLLTSTSAQVSWTLDQPATGQVQYGTTVGYGAVTTPETSFIYSTHVQAISGLTASTLYHYRIVSTNSAGQTLTSDDYTFTTPAATSTPSMYSNTYGPGFGIDSKANLPADDRNISIRFIAGVTSNVVSVVLPWRWGSGYSLGNAGTYAVEVQSDDGTGSHKPSGSVLGAAAPTFTPSTADKALSDTRYYISTFATPAPVTAGGIYHIVIRNTAASPASNYTSINMTLRALGASYGGTAPAGTRHPAFTDDLAAMYGASWTVRDESPVFNITYADGSHDGQTYMVAGCGTGPTSYGGSTIVRQRFTVSGGDRTVTGLYVRSKLLSGSGALTVSLRTTSALVDSVTVLNGSMTTLAAGCNDNGPLWLGGTFSVSRTLSDATAYEVRLSTPAGTSMRLESPLREESSGSTGDRVSAAARWKDRLSSPEVSTNSGSTWGVIYSAFPNDMPFYFTLA